MNKDTPCIVAQRMKDQRKALGKTQKDIAEKTELSTKTINNLEHMTAPTLSVDTFIRLCDALECSADYLLGKDDLPTHELTDIHNMMGFSAEAIDKQMQRESYRKAIHHSDYNLINDFISHMLINMNFDNVVRHIRSLAWKQIYDDASVEFNKRLDDEEERLEAAMKNKTDEDKAYAAHLHGMAATLLNNYSDHQDAADAATLRLTHELVKVLDSFSEKQQPIIQEQIYQEFFNGKENFMPELEREVFRNEKR